MNRRVAALLLCLLPVPGSTSLCYADQALQADDSVFVRWAKEHAIPIRSVQAGTDVSDLRSLDAVIASARVVAFGEAAHGAHETLTFRNRLFEYLVNELGFTAIALESGLPESRRIDDFVTGGAGDAAQVVAANMTWGFGTFPENVELVSWMRAYNSDPRHTRKIHFYGMDLSLGGPQGSTPTPAAIDQH